MAALLMGEAKGSDTPQDKRRAGGGRAQLVRTFPKRKRGLCRKGAALHWVWCSAVSPHAIYQGDGL